MLAPNCAADRMPPAARVALINICDPPSRFGDAALWRYGTVGFVGIGECGGWTARGLARCARPGGGERKALGVAMEKLLEAGTLKKAPIRDFGAAVSVGIVEGSILLDLCYEEDSQAEVDLNFVMTGGRKIVEIQATAEKHPFDETQLKRMMDLAANGVESLIDRQKAVLRNLPVLPLA